MELQSHTGMAAMAPGNPREWSLTMEFTALCTLAILMLGVNVLYWARLGYTVPVLWARGLSN